MVYEDENGKIEYKGILKEYTTDYIEIVEVMYKNGIKDLILPRRNSVVRYGIL